MLEIRTLRSYCCISEQKPSKSIWFALRIESSRAATMSQKRMSGGAINEVSKTLQPLLNVQITPSCSTTQWKRVTSWLQFSLCQRASGLNRFQVGPLPWSISPNEKLSRCLCEKWKQSLSRRLRPVLDFQLLNSSKSLIAGNEYRTHRQRVSGDHDVQVPHRLSFAFQHGPKVSILPGCL